MPVEEQNTGPRDRPADASPDRSADASLLPAGGERLESAVAEGAAPPEGTASMPTLGLIAQRVLERIGHPAGRLVFANGPCDAYAPETSPEGIGRTPGDSIVARTPSDLLYAGEAIVTGRRTHALLELGAGSRVWVAPSTRVVLPEGGEGGAGERLRLLGGAVLCLRVPDAPITVATPGGTIQCAPGAVSVVALGNERAVVDVLEGGAVVSTRKAARVQLSYGEGTAFDATLEPTPAKAAPPARSLGWLGAVGNDPTLAAEARERLAAFFPKGFPTDFEDAGAGERVARAAAAGPAVALMETKAFKIVVVAIVVVVLAVAGYVYWSRLSRRSPNPRDWRGRGDPLRIPAFDRRDRPPQPGTQPSPTPAPAAPQDTPTPP